MTSIRMKIVVAAATFSVVGGLVAGCSGSGSRASGSTNPSSAAGLPTCPVNALATATAPVQITFWHAMNRSLEETLQKLTDQYNASQQKVQVKLVNQSTYVDNFNKFKSGLTSGELPDVVQFEDVATQQAIDTQAFVPAQSCIKTDKYSLADYIPRVLTRYTVQKVLWPMPFNVSNPVFFYDKNAFRAAGLDPAKPPTTLEEVKADAQKIKATGQYEAGYGLKLDPWFVEQWSAKANQLYVNQENGRKTRATGVLFDNATGRGIFAWMDDMVKSGLAITNSAEGASAYDNLLGLRSKSVAMTIDTSAALGTMSLVLESGEGGGVDLGVGPMPGPIGKGGVVVSGGGLYIVKKSSAQKQAAVWDYLKFLDTPESQATWAAGTGYVPIRKSSVDLPTVQQLWSTTPGYKVAYDQLLTGADDIATQGPVIGAYYDVRDAVLNGEQEMFTQGKSSKAAIKSAASQANSAMHEYNSRVVG